MEVLLFLGSEWSDFAKTQTVMTVSLSTQVVKPA